MLKMLTWFYGQNAQNAEGRCSMRFQGKCAVVTGASSGIGWKLSLAFAAEGATVIAVARRREKLESLSEMALELPGQIIAFPGDVAEQEVNDNMIDFAVEKCGKLDVLVNNAGIMDEFVPIGELSNEKMDRIFQVNFIGPFYAMRKAVNTMLMQETGGNIVNVGSIGGICGCRAGAAYTAAKHALIGLTKNTAYMYADRLIRCNALCPGGVDTEVMNSQTDISQLGMSRVMAGVDRNIGSGKPEDIASAVLYMASDEARFMNGSVVVLDGGVSCR